MLCRMTKKKQYPSMTHPREQWPDSQQSAPESGMCTNSPSHCPLCKKNPHILMIFKLFTTTYHFGFWNENGTSSYFLLKVFFASIFIFLAFPHTRNNSKDVWPEDCVDVVKCQGCPQSFECPWVERIAVQSLQQRFSIDWTLLYLYKHA